MEPTPRSLILDLLSTVRRGSVPVRALVSAGDCFGIAGGSIRVALARLLAEGRVERDERGRYRLGDAAAAIRNELSAWHRAEERSGPWTGGWIAVHTAGLARSSTRGRRLRLQALRFLGFRAFVPGLELRPDNLEGGVASVRERLRGLGLDREAPVCALSDLDAESDRRARTLWDIAALERGYRATCATLAESAERLPLLSRDEAMVESFILGGNAIRQIVLDPLLPTPIADPVPRRALLEALRAYDRLGRAAWAGWLGDEVAEPEHCPAGVSGLDAAGPLLRAVGGN